MWGVGRGYVVQKADRDDGHAAVVGSGQRLAVERDGVPGIFGAAPGEAAAREAVGDLAGVFARAEVQAVEVGVVGERPADADGDVGFAVVGEDGGYGERRVG